MISLTTHKLLAAAIVIVALFSTYELASAIHIAQTTGSLQAISGPGTTLALSQSNHQVTVIGVTRARVRLQPGLYEVIATSGQNQAIKSVQIYKGRLVSLTLQPISIEQEKQTKNNIEANALIKLLPFTGPASEYRIDFFYKFNATTAQPVITILAPTTQAQQDAVSKIKAFGFDPSKLELKYLTTDLTGVE